MAAKKLNLDSFVVKPNAKVKLSNFDPGFTNGYEDKKAARAQLDAGVKQLAKYQDVLYAHDQYAVLLIFQAMDAAGKDSTIKHVMSGVNPQGCQVFNFKAPSDEELDHTFLWRSMKCLPERGRIGIFNRSYYEEVLIARVHPEILGKQKLPTKLVDQKIWQQRFEDINNFEHYLTNNGVVVVKFFLHLSKQEQKKRFLARIDRPAKNWKFHIADVQERQFWDEYNDAYEDVFNHTSTKWAPWHIIPADHKWFTRLVVAKIIVKKLEKLKLHYPKMSDDHRHHLIQARMMLESEE
ncbi:Polyphosphate:AMP phosphotransferase [Thalassoporum mexicanum PCC 7367]|uniref:polyphosphate kinase 2 family protein n=1 Tax=Thalassoporum mexicanum TaxID=3457544 RepID=UPI00029FE62E|nr:polyphosphate kinase 2 family protein [Pseudanabaena sp. PCC 7367]AFY71485.1 Polyphosphate:AMP phosphotransferase [Pseudanabaena sp. PCC 7367]